MSRSGGVTLGKREGSAGECVKPPRSAKLRGFVPLVGGLGLSTGRASAPGMDTTKGGFSKESTVLTLIQFKIRLETHSKRAPSAACLPLSGPQHEMH